MSCDKYNASKAKELAEKMFAAGELDGAKRFALLAQNLYPELDGVHQFLATLDVHLAVRESIDDVVDWYRILGVEPLADDDTIKKHYKKRALMLHPDKNKSIGAEGAFHIISQAWSMLSDKSKRIKYDVQWKSIYGKVPVQDPFPLVSTGENHFHNFTNSNNVNAQDLKKPPSPRCSTSRRRSKPATFWTACSTCKMNFEYPRANINWNILCPNCHKPFLAKETTSPPSNGKKFSTQWSSSKRQRNSSQTTVDDSPRTKPDSATTATPSGSSSIDPSHETVQTYAFFKSSSSTSSAKEVQPSCGQLKRALHE